MATPFRKISLEQALDDSPVLVEHGRRKLNVLYRASMILGVELRQGIRLGNFPVGDHGAQLCTEQAAPTSHRGARADPVSAKNHDNPVVRQGEWS